jgi:hypothetical protein
LAGNRNRKKEKVFLARLFDTVFSNYFRAALRHFQLSTHVLQARFVIDVQQRSSVNARKKPISFNVTLSAVLGQELQ